ncbi:hypothetical protein MRX96_032606 [Rhipicephalus microplus]
MSSTSAATKSRLERHQSSSSKKSAPHHQKAYKRQVEDLLWGLPVVCEDVEKVTQDQSASDTWFAFRANRVTASTAHEASRMSLTQPPLIVVNIAIVVGQSLLTWWNVVARTAWEKWFRFKFANLKRRPKEKAWFCRDCKPHKK